ncbi:unnamed protein product [Rotaria magnacalcarata]|uniref:Uncharacterized protein n=1 Tax=Rotaria magnacalcarata TaxID=392030 RepID=A0A816P2Y9_9BILA|nr:unnamed protein product [Rotaria magnacalcarata]CAF1593577.1 unnamed protein product [Rotaria magnacalcarata]CAF2043742.1 unnamed protein product [Rotaria magnacalcarata]CAF2253447.1 unnamed protein product [Rotaria magnacalcarata]
MFSSSSVKYILCIDFEMISSKDNQQLPKFENKSWPNLVGKPVDEAVEEIKRADPTLHVVKIQNNSPVTLDLRFNRVRVFFGEDGKVSQTPATG